MSRRLFAAVALVVLVAACSDTPVLDATGSNVTSTLGSTSSAVASSDAPSTSTTMPPSTTSTTVSQTTSTTTSTTSTTTTPTTTTTVIAAPVTSDASLPTGATGRHLIPWGDVDEEWVLALYSGDKVAGGAENGPTVLYLVSPTADYYEITAWPAEGRKPYAIADWSPDRRRALVHLWPAQSPNNDHRLVMVDLGDGSRANALTMPDTTWTLDAAFTQPTGKNFVVGTDDGTTERLEVHRSGGANAVLVERPSATEGIDWLYGRSGVSVVVSDVDGIRLLDNQGTLIRNLDTPGFDCQVPRWWSNDEVLAACIPPTEYAAGNWYHQLWVVPDDGTAATPLTSVPSGPIIVVDFGMVDARRVAGETILQWRGDCSASSILIRQSDGSGVGIPTNFPVIVGGVELVSPQGPRLAVRYWDDCGQSQSWLGQIELDGTFRGELVPKVADRAGVVSVASLP
jgi:hypothetical protein